MSIAEAADAAQHCLDSRFAVPVFAHVPVLSGAYRNTSPLHLRQALPLNHWWLSHAIDTRLDAFHRTGDERRLHQAEATLRYLRVRNRGLFNDYFDDLGWLALALIGLHEATGSARRLDDAVSVWRRIRSRGWNRLEGPSVSWRVPQPGYKNAPSNGTFALASARLHRLTGDERYRVAADETVQWLLDRLVTPEGVVLDGVNRTGDHRVDDGWVFSYNQGVVAAAVLERRWIPDATATAGRIARAALPRLAPAGVVLGEEARSDHAGGGDAGLFKGIHARYLALVAEALPAGDRDRDALVAYLDTATDALRGSFSAPAGEHAAGPVADVGRAGDDWSRPAPPTTFLSTQLAATMALEARWRLDQSRTTS
ncbi:glycoside hydrolase family 76 protein [Herbiconiux sp. P18]|uniref:glycoside hydrolase family 76 protein n=1 Tax=Herbiconiux liangxiaofengii TaxID=3342795 RepID=UPI0035B88DE7